MHKFRDFFAQFFKSSVYTVFAADSMVISFNSGRFAVTVAARSFDDENGSYTKVCLSEKISLICFGGDGKTFFTPRRALYLARPAC